jgi:N-acyl-D-amino-acid deacylase
MTYDLVIRSGNVVDGSGSPAFKADVAVADGKIPAVGDLGSARAEQVIDATGLVVSPGFIDMHSHSDLVLLINPAAESKVRQGITTEVVGNCSFSIAPLTQKNLRLMANRYGSLAQQVKWDWISFGKYMDKLDKQGISLNVAALIGHGTIRSAVMAFDNRSPTDSELRRMKALVNQSMKEGAFGMSTGLIYVPSCYAPTYELIELSKVVASHKGFYATDTRGQSETMLQATLEAMDIAELARIPVHISHNVPHIIGAKPTGRAEINLRIVDEAIARGLDITGDVYAYDAGSTSLKAMVPPWANEGGDSALIRRLKNRKIRQRIREETLKEGARSGGTACRALAKLGKWDRILLANCEKNKDLIGKTFAEIAKKRGVDPFDALFDLLIEESTIGTIIGFNRFEEEVEASMKHYSTMIGSDGYALAPYGVLGEGQNHPRSYGNHPRVLAKYVRERKIMTLEEAVRKMTSFPASRLGVKDRGFVREDMWADLVIFNKDTVRDTATFEKPYQYPEGIEYVIVNGKVVVEKGQHTGARPGKALRHKAS